MRLLARVPWRVTTSVSLCQQRVLSATGQRGKPSASCHHCSTTGREIDLSPQGSGKRADPSAPEPPGC
ncbi:unnamed protein product [Gadus morhua 'NCC']